MTGITTAKMKEITARPDHVIIDVRPAAAYNGWRLQNEPRGGHIPGARSLPHKWSKYIDWIEIVRSKGILPERQIVLYGYNLEETEEVAAMFRTAGYNTLYTYNGFLQEWAPDFDLPLLQLKKYRQLIYPQWIHTLISGNDPPEYDGSDYVICHVHYRNRADYEKGHIPGAISLDTLTLESPDTWNRRSPEELEEALTALGITPDTTVILYGRFAFPRNDDPFPGSSAGHLGAMRAAFIMMYAGVKDVRILNGGLRAWEDEGYATTKLEFHPRPATSFGAVIPGKPELAVDLPEAREILASTDGELVCVRSLPEYRGEVSGYNYIDKKGRIPGAVFGNCGSDAYHMENYRNLDHTTREFHEIEKIWQDEAITPDKHIAFYCGTGWRGSEAFFNAWLMGWPRVSVFDGGWFEWSNDPANPIETGEAGK